MNVDDPKSASGIIAVSLRCPSTRTNATSAIRPAVNAKEAVADQPRDELSVNAHVAKPRPIVARRAPAPSSEAPFPMSSLGTDRKANQIATVAMGTLIRKIRRQDPRSISHPPRTG